MLQQPDDKRQLPVFMPRLFPPSRSAGDVHRFFRGNVDDTNRAVHVSTLALPALWFDGQGGSPGTPLVCRRPPPETRTMRTGARELGVVEAVGEKGESRQLYLGLRRGLQRPGSDRADCQRDASEASFRSARPRRTKDRAARN